MQHMVLCNTKTILIMKGIAAISGFSGKAQKDPSTLGNGQVGRWERKFLAIPKPHRQLLVPFSKLQLLWPILYLDFFPPIKVILFLFGTVAWCAFSDTAWPMSPVYISQINREQNIKSHHQVSSISGSLNSAKSNNRPCLDQTLPSETGQADIPIIKWVHFEIPAPRQPPFSCQSCTIWF